LNPRTGNYFTQRSYYNYLNGND